MTPEKSTTTARRSALRPKLSTLTLLCALSVLPLNVFLPSLANIAQDFRADYALVSLSLAGYAIVAIALELIMGPLSDRFGRRPIVMVSLATFTIGSIGCAFASDIWTFLAFRLAPGGNHVLLSNFDGDYQGYGRQCRAPMPAPFGAAEPGWKRGRLGRRYDPCGWRSPFLDHRGRPDGGQRNLCAVLHHAFFRRVRAFGGCARSAPARRFSVLSDVMPSLINTRSLRLKKSSACGWGGRGGLITTFQQQQLRQHRVASGHRKLPC